MACSEHKLSWPQCPHKRGGAYTPSAEDATPGIAQLRHTRTLWSALFRSTRVNTRIEHVGLINLDFVNIHIKVHERKYLVHSSNLPYLKYI